MTMKHCKELTLVATLELDNTYYVALLKFTCVRTVLVKKTVRLDVSSPKNLTGSKKWCKLEAKVTAGNMQGGLEAVHQQYVHCMSSSQAAKTPCTPEQSGA